MKHTQDYFLYPDWDVSKRVHAVVTTRRGGVSLAPFDSMNLATHVGDDPSAVDSNRKLLRQRLQLPAEPHWLEQVHGITIADSQCDQACQADAYYTNQENKVGVVLTADCLPVFISDISGTEVAVAHAGWKGLLNGVIEQSVACFSSSYESLRVWLGPAIGPEQFEVGQEVFDAFMQEAEGKSEEVRKAFTRKSSDKWLADIYALARFRLRRMGITAVSGGDFCTVTDEQMFYSYRRDGKTGRMASLIWIEQ